MAFNTTIIFSFVMVVIVIQHASCYPSHEGEGILASIMHPFKQHSKTSHEDKGKTMGNTVYDVDSVKHHSNASQNYSPGHDHLETNPNQLPHYSPHPEGNQYNSNLINHNKKVDTSGSNSFHERRIHHTDLPVDSDHGYSRNQITGYNTGDLVNYTQNNSKECAHDVVLVETRPNPHQVPHHSHHLEENQYDSNGIHQEKIDTSEKNGFHEHIKIHPADSPVDSGFLLNRNHTQYDSLGFAHSNDYVETRSYPNQLPHHSPHPEVNQYDRNLINHNKKVDSSGSNSLHQRRIHHTDLHVDSDRGYESNHITGYHTGDLVNQTQNVSHEYAQVQDQQVSGYSHQTSGFHKRNHPAVVNCQQSIGTC